MRIVTVTPDFSDFGVPGQVALVLSNGTSYVREHFPYDCSALARALAQLPADQGLIALLDDGRAWPFCIDAAQKIVDVFASPLHQTPNLRSLSASDRAKSFEEALTCALEQEPSIPRILVRARLAS